MRRTRTVLIANYQNKPIKRTLGLFVPTETFERPYIYFGGKKERTELFHLWQYLDVIDKGVVSELALWGTISLHYAGDYHPALTPLVEKRFCIDSFFSNLEFYKSVTDYKLKIKNGTDIEKEVNHLFSFVWHLTSTTPLDPELSGSALSQYVLANTEWFFSTTKKQNFLELSVEIKDEFARYLENI